MSHALTAPLTRNDCIILAALCDHSSDMSVPAGLVLALAGPCMLVQQLTQQLFHTTVFSSSYVCLCLPAIFALIFHLSLKCFLAFCIFLLNFLSNPPPGKLPGHFVPADLSSLVGRCQGFWPTCHLSGGSFLWRVVVAYLLYVPFFSRSYSFLCLTQL